jgi:NAD(P)H-dependent FMN reductase
MDSCAMCGARAGRVTTLTAGTASRAYCDACLALHVRGAKVLGELVAILDADFDALVAACADDPEQARTVDRAIEHVDAFLDTLDPIHLRSALDIIEEGIPPGRRPPGLAALAAVLHR